MATLLESDGLCLLHLAQVGQVAKVAMTTAASHFELRVGVLGGLTKTLHRHTTVVIASVWVNRWDILIHLILVLVIVLG